MSSSFGNAGFSSNHMDHYFTPNLDMVVHNMKNTETTINNNYNKEVKENVNLL